MAKFDSAYAGARGQAFGQNMSISQLAPRDADALSRKLESLRRGRQTIEKDWKLNLAFYQGNQYVQYNKRSGGIDFLPTEDNEKPRYRVRIVSNQIQTGSHSLLSKLTKTKPQISATPGSGSSSDLRAAQVAETLFEHWWHDLQLNDKLQEALLWGIIAGQGWWKISWDKHASKSMKFLLGPDGQPVLDEELADLFRSQLKQMQVEPQEMTMYLGDIRVDAMSPFDVYVDPSAHVFEEARYAFCGHAMDPDEIKARWGKVVQPDSVPADPYMVMPYKTAEDRVNPTVKKVWIGYILPQPAMPRGRYVAFCENPNIILDDGPWPYPTAQLPLVKFPGVRVPGSIYDDAVVTAARPLQKELNRTVSQIVEYKNLTIKPRIVTPVGSMRQKITNEPGQVIEFQPIGGLKPEIERLPTMPPYVFEHLKDISGRLRDVFGLTEVTQGSVPPNVEAGVAIDLLQEMATDRWEPTITQIEGGLARAGKLMIALAQKYYIEPRLIKVYGDGGSVKVKQFLQSDIDSGVDFYAEAGSGLPRTRAGKQARVEWMLDKGLIRPDQAWKHIDTADMKSLTVKLAAHEDQAEREHEKILQGIPLSPEEWQHAQQATSMGMNPDTGMPLMSEGEMQQVLMAAVVRPGPFDNDMVHMDVHAHKAVSVEFEGWPSDARERMHLHMHLHQQRMSSQTPQPEPQAPRTSLQLRGTVDPDTAAKIISAGGVDANAEELRQPPLLTMEMDNIDKPDIDTAGNDPLTAAEVQQHNAEQAAHSSVLAAAKAREGDAKARFAERKANPADPLGETGPHTRPQSSGGR